MSKRNSALPWLRHRPWAVPGARVRLAPVVARRMRLAVPPERRGTILALLPGRTGRLAEGVRVTVRWDDGTEQACYARFLVQQQQQQQQQREVTGGEEES